MSTLLLFYRHKLLRRDARSPGGRDSAGLLVYAVRRTVSVIQRILCFVACPMKRKGRALRVRWKKRCRFPAASMRASGMKAEAAKSGGRMERSRSMSHRSLACLRYMPLAVSRVVRPLIVRPAA